ncbi:Uncharacterized protein CH35J_004220 [Colletotrichum higginsianum]|uniref:Duf1941 family protein n=1 Tax=Colletotrichum higginsianum TaxID=80884 RepID=A0A4T0WAR0_9PEZI|nr:Uncharacterized protein CH35J_004220 [Colletotrichum higginsianum]
MLEAKDDTSRFVGLALLKSLLDNSEELRNDSETVLGLWESISPKFLDRLVRTGISAQATQKDAKNMMDLAVSVIHTFTLLLPDQSRRDKRLVGRLPLLVSSLLQSSEETSKLITQTIHTLVTFPEGAKAFSEVDDALPASPKWIKSVVDFIKKLLTSRPTPEARNAYTIAAASLLEVYPTEASKLLFTSDVKEDKPFSYLFITLLLTDTRATLPRLLELLNDSIYPAIAQRLGSAFDVTTHFIGYLVRSLDDEMSSSSNLIMPPEFLLKIRRTISEAMSLAIEFLRDRWDASVAGTFGLHPDSRTKETDTSMGKRLTISWESKKDTIHEDPLILAAVRSLALWLREDDNELLRKEAAGLTDMFIDLYNASSPAGLDFRSPVLVGLEGILTEKAGLEEFSTHNGWEALTKDLLGIHQHTSTASDENEAARAVQIVRILLPIVESEVTGSREEWMALVTAVAAWEAPEAEQPLLVQEAQVAVLQLSTALLVGATEGMKRRYVHSTSAILGIAARLEEHVGDDHPLRESLVDVLQTLGRFR